MNSRRVPLSSPSVWVFQTTGGAVGFRASAAGFEQPFFGNIFFYFLLAKPRLISENTFMAQCPGRVMFPLCQDSNSSRITSCFCTGVCAQRPPLLLFSQTLPVASPVPHHHTLLQQLGTGVVGARQEEFWGYYIITDDKQSEGLMMRKDWTLM